ncbi:MAG: L-seryl-tRNA(Sec) selenium transferase [Planctomycetota bacterium]|jgi:L-seryl-tRNA(Ser) seleniumtransferase
MSASPEDLLRKIPSVDALLQDEGRAEWAEGVPRGIVVESLRSAAEQVRGEILAGQHPEATQEALREAILARARRRARAITGPHYRKVINATGIILHTGLGRAVLAERAVRQIQRELSGYSLLQLSTESGKRSKREERIEELLRRLTGAETATVVNNNAAATLIVLNTVAAGREVIVSRGQLVEIGGAFRLPEVMAAGGVSLVEVGTTNRTHPRDYENAISENTAAILRCHPSNYVISGFASEVPIEELERIAHARGLILIDDVGAGPLIDFSRFGFRQEPTLPDSIRAGADLVTSSADKLIGGPQGGIILGRADLVEAVRRNPLARAVRVGKLTLAALEATLTLFLDETLALGELPILRMLRREPDELAQQARRIADAVRERCPQVEVAVVEGCSQMGSGSLPGQELPTHLVAVRPQADAAEELAARLRRHEPPLFTRIQQGRVLADPRTLLPGEEGTLLEALVEALGGETVEG